VAEYVQTLVDVFNRVHRVLKDDGTLWLNLGDTYSSGGDFKPKNLMMIPSRVAIALQDAGWYLRSQIVWAKGNPIPESMKDRPTSSWESIFLLAKNERYYYDQDAVRCDDGYGANCRNLWHVNPRPYKGAHFATMPSEIATRCVLAGSRAGDAILDPFAGAGTTGVVAKQHDRDATLIELNRDYVDIINSRLLDTHPVRPDIPFLTWR
jgi:site-specific DNA-methyltransferase (adenine-specific)